MKKNAPGRHRPRYGRLLCLAGLTFLLALPALAQERLQTRINIAFTAQPLSRSLQQLQQEAKVSIAFTQADVAPYRTPAANFRSATLEDVLQSLLKGTRLAFRESNHYIIISAVHPDSVKPTGAPVRAAGIVLDAKNGEPLPGVTVVVKNTLRGASTGASGEYSLEAAQGDTLVFTYMGYQRREAIAASSMQVRLQQSAGDLGEVVVLGFGQKQAKIAQTGAIASITTKEIKQSPVANIANALAGRLPGLVTLQQSGEPGKDGPRMFIRGLATTNSATPLFTIDGVQKDQNALALLDPNEVESITILKDASATALYGVQGANGVVIIKTRRGVEGKPRINMGLQRSIQQATRLPEFLGSYDLARLANEAYYNDNPSGSLPPYTEEALEAYRTGSAPYKYPDVNWMKEMLKPAGMTRADFSINGGTKMVKYFVNTGYTQQNGLYKTEKNDQYDPTLKYRRYNFRSNVDIDFDKDFSIGLSLFGSIENKNQPNADTEDIFTFLEKTPANAFPIRYPIGNYGGVTRGNPFALVNTTGYRESFNSSLSGMLSATRRLDALLKGLSLNGNYSFDGYFVNNFTRSKETRTAMYSGNGDVNDPANYTFTGSDSPLKAPSSSFTQTRSTWLDFSLNYENTFRQHTVTGLLLANRQQIVRGGEIPYVYQGLVSRITYNYRNRYFAEFNAGYNGTDNFARNRRYGFFPAVSAGWVLSEENFLKNSTLVDFLKLRASYGLTGNDKLSSRRWLFVTEFNNGSGYGYGEPLQNVGGKQEGPMANADVTWEKARKLNLGLEFTMLKGLLGVTADFFREKRNDILITRGTVPGMIGVPTGNLPPANMGVVVNRGLELELTHRRQAGPISYYVRANGSFARNKVLFQDEVSQPYAYLRRTGQRLYQFYGYTAVGFFQSREEIENSPRQFGNVIPGDIRYKDLNGDGVIDANDRGPIGKSDIPEFLYGLSGGISWKNFDLSVLFQGAGNYNVFMSHEAAWEFYNGASVMRQHLGRWTPETAATATYPVLHYGQNTNNHQERSTFFMKDGTYIRLKNAELGYTFRNLRLSKQKGMDAIRVFANGMNLFTWDRMGDGNFDPEAPSGKGFFYPQLRVVNFGFSANF
ncbi:TonB-dependent receptor [Chitinophaga lutea]